MEKFKYLLRLFIFMIEYKHLAVSEDTKKNISLCRAKLSLLNPFERYTDKKIVELAINNFMIYLEGKNEQSR